MSQEPDDPPRKFYGLKPRQFEQLNAPGATPAKDTAHDVHAMLQHNRAVEQRHGHDEIEVRPVSSRRKRDYWLLLIVSNVLVLALLKIVGLNVVSVIFALSAMVILTLGLTWVMWFVMDRY